MRSKYQGLSIDRYSQEHRYRGRHLFRPMAEMLVNLGFDHLKLSSATVMTNEENPSTNHVFKSLGFKEFFREPKPDWHNPAIGIHYRCSRADRTAGEKVLV